MNSTQLDKEILSYWEEEPPMSFTREHRSYEEKRKMRYSLQDYMHDTFRFKDFSQKKVLDLGCGAGIDSAEFARNGAEVTCLDLTATATRLTKNLVKEAELQAHVIQADARSIPFRREVFDCVYSFGLLHHIPDVDRALMSIETCLKPWGLVMVMLYHRDSILYAYSILYLRGVKEGLLKSFDSDSLLSRYSERREGCPYTKAYTKTEAVSLFSKHFRDVSAEVHFNVVDILSNRKFKLNIPDEFQLGWHLIVKAKN